MNRRLVFIGIMMFASLALARPGLAADKLRFASALKDYVPHVLPALAAEEKGFWKQQALSVEWFPMKGGATMHRAFAAGALDMGLSSAVSGIQAMARGVPEIIVADLKQTDQTFIWVPVNSRIKTPADLKGAKLGVKQYGGMVHAYGLALAKALGLREEIKFVAAGGLVEEFAAIKAGILDGRVGPYMGHVDLKVKGLLREVVSAEDYMAKDWVDKVLLAEIKYAEAKPDTVGRTIKAIILASQFIKKNPEWAIARIESFHGFSREASRLIWEKLDPATDGKINVKGLSNVVSFLVEYDIIKKAPPLDKLYTARFTE